MQVGHHRCLCRFRQTGTVGSRVKQGKGEAIMTDQVLRTPKVRIALVATFAALAGIAPVAAHAESYCFKSGPEGADTLRLDVAGNGSLRFALDSWQGGGHNCAASGKAKAVKGGWVYREKIGGDTCEIILARQSDGGITLTDTDNRCRPALCGARAVISGLSFPAKSQVDCASMPTG
jgi:hypothetical protein